MNATDLLALAQAALEDDARLPARPWVVDSHRDKMWNVADAESYHLFNGWKDEDDRRGRVVVEGVVAMRNREPLLAKVVLAAMDREKLADVICATDHDASSLVIADAVIAHLVAQVKP